jgi:hypothetical protein
LYGCCSTCAAKGREKTKSFSVCISSFLIFFPHFSHKYSFLTNSEAPKAQIKDLEFQEQIDNFETHVSEIVSQKAQQVAKSI